MSMEDREVSRATWLLAALTLLSGASGLALADEKKAPVKEESSFGSLKGPTAEEVQTQASAWLKETAKKTDAVSQEKFKAIWTSDRPVSDKLAETFVLGSPEAAKILAQARNPEAPAPTEVPALLKDGKVPAFFRANLTLAYAKALTTRRVYEEALEVFQTIKAEDVVDPSALLFHKAVCEHALMLKDKADLTIDRLLVDVSDSPERYRMVAALMHFDMVTWQDKDLGWIARKMENIQRRLDLKRGGKQTQKIQKEVIVRLDEMIKEIENKRKSPPPPPPGSPPGSGGDNDGQCPSGGPPGPDAPGTQPQSSSPQRDTQGGTTTGKGEVESKKVKELAEVWGKLPEKERVKMLLELTRSMPAKDRAVIESYFKELQKKASK
jgi:hypothetical protein